MRRKMFRNSRAAGKCDFDIDVFYNRIIIDAKSILGVLSMDLTKVLTVQCHGESKEFNYITVCRSLIK